MAGFGLIHELSTVEIQVRRKLQNSRHLIDASMRYMADNVELNSDDIKKIEAMLREALDSISEVIGN